MNEVDTHNGTRVIPLGGVGEFGANACVVSYGDAAILVDYGLMFPPDLRQPGVEFYINDPKLVLEQFPNLCAIFITHAHEDHIGGLGFLLEQRNLPVYTMPYTAAILQKSLDYHDVQAEIHRVKLNEPVTIEQISVEFIGVTHSIVQACALSIRTPDGHMIHSGDFKVDAVPDDNHPFQSDRLRALGDAGVDLLIMDSTNAGKRGFCPPDADIMPHLERHIREARGRVFLTTFSSHMPRIRKLLEVAARCGRKLAFVGRSFRKHFHAAVETGYLAYQGDLVIDPDHALQLPPDKVLFVVAGSQGEPRSSLTQIARDGFRGISFQSDDTMIFSSKHIPGNERQIMLLVSAMERRGIKVITSSSSMVHTSGHAYREDLAYLLSLTRPSHVAPIHGEHHQLLAHHEWLQSLVGGDCQVLFFEDGDVITLKEGEVRATGRIEVGMVPIDGNQNIPVDFRVLKERKDMMYNGMVLINATTGQGEPQFEVDCHGVVGPKLGEHTTALIKELGAMVFKADVDDAVLAETIHKKARSIMKRIISGRPLIKLVLNGRIRK